MARAGRWIGPLTRQQKGRIMQSSGSTITIAGPVRPLREPSLEVERAGATRAAERTVRYPEALTEPVSAETIVAVDQRPLLRSGLARIVWRAFDSHAVVVADLDQAAAGMRFSGVGPRALLLGLRPGDEPAEMVRDAREIAPAVICVLDCSDPVLTRAAVAADANGYMLIEEISPETLSDTLLAIEAGDTVLPATLEARRRSGDGDAPPITDRCHEVLRSVAAGMHDDEIAAQLGISIRSVRKHIASAQARLQARTRIHALAIAAREGLV
jgi:two-component system NarL family response regulator